MDHVLSVAVIEWRGVRLADIWELKSYVACGAFHDSSTKGLHHQFFMLMKCRLERSFVPWRRWWHCQTPEVNGFLDLPWAFWLEITRQGCLWRPLASRSINIMHIIDISSWSQWTRQHVCHLKSSKKKNFWWLHTYIFFLFVPIHLPPKAFTCLISKWKLVAFLTI